MAVIDDNKGWIRDTRTGDVLEFDTYEAMVSRERFYDGVAGRLADQVAEEPVTDIQRGGQLKTLKALAGLFKNEAR